jgi:hypothetical protein
MATGDAFDLWLPPRYLVLAQSLVGAMFIAFAAVYTFGALRSPFTAFFFALVGGSNVGLAAGFAGMRRMVRRHMVAAHSGVPFPAEPIT